MCERNAFYIQASCICLEANSLRDSEQSAANFTICQPAGWIKMPIGTEVGLGLRGIVFDVDPATPRKRHTHSYPFFGPCLLWPDGWMDEDAAWYGSRPRTRPHCPRRGPSSRERGTAAPLFSVHVYCGHGRPSQLYCWALVSLLTLSSTVHF